METLGPIGGATLVLPAGMSGRHGAWLDGVGSDGQLVLDGADLRGWRPDGGADLSRARFIQCNLSGVDFSNAKLTRAEFIDCRLNGTNVADSWLIESRFERCEGLATRMDGSEAGAVEIRNCRLPSLDLRDARAAKSGWEHTQIPSAILEGCR